MLQRTCRACIRVCSHLFTSSQDFWWFEEILICLRGARHTPSPFDCLHFLLQGLKNVTVMEGESVTLECHISGYPLPKVTWYREDYQIESSIDFQMSFQGGAARLLIREAFAEDSGRFTCSAANEAGTVSTSCYLAVQGQCLGCTPRCLLGWE